MRATSSGEVRTREMESGDLTEILGIERQSFVSPWSRQVFEETLDFPLSVNLVLTLDGTIVAYMNLYVISSVLRRF